MSFIVIKDIQTKDVYFDLEKAFPKSPQYVGNIFAKSAESLLFHQLKGALKVHAPRANIY